MSEITTTTAAMQVTSQTRGVGRPRGRNQAFGNAKKKKFLKKLKETMNVTLSAESVCVHPQTTYYHRRHDPVFEAAWEEALRDAVCELEGAAYNRALNGTKKGVYFNGVKVDEEVQTHDSLTQFMLKAHAPERYGDRKAVELSGPNGGPIRLDETKHKLLDLLGVSFDELETDQS